MYEKVNNVLLSKHGCIFLIYFFMYKVFIHSINICNMMAIINKVIIVQYADNRHC